MKLWLALGVLLLAGVGALLLLGDRDGGPTQAATGTARLQWKEKPSLILVPSMPQDRILTGQLRNASLHSVDLDTEQVRILDGKGRALRSTALFSQHFSHGLYPWSWHVKGSKFERARIGKIVDDQARPGGAADALLARAGGRLGAGRGALRRRLADAPSLSGRAGGVIFCRACLRTPSTRGRNSRSGARPSRSSGSTRSNPSSTSPGFRSR